MNTHRLTAMAMVVALAGFAHTLAAEEAVPTFTTDDTLGQNAAELKPETEILVPESDTPAQTVSQPAETLLSDLKVYPSF